MKAIVNTMVCPMFSTPSPSTVEDEVLYGMVVQVEGFAVDVGCLGKRRDGDLAEVALRGKREEGLLDGCLGFRPTAIASVFVDFLHVWILLLANTHL